jgi:hypothetical protein
VLTQTRDGIDSGQGRLEGGSVGVFPRLAHTSKARPGAGESRVSFCSPVASLEQWLASRTETPPATPFDFPIIMGRGESAASSVTCTPFTWKLVVNPPMIMEREFRTLFRTDSLGVGEVTATLTWRRPNSRLFHYGYISQRLYFRKSIFLRVNQLFALFIQLITINHASLCKYYIIPRFIETL